MDREQTKRPSFFRAPLMEYHPRFKHPRVP